MMKFHKQNKQLQNLNLILLQMNKSKNTNKFWNNFKKYYEYFNLPSLIPNYFTHSLIFFNIISKMLYFIPIIVIKFL